MFRSLSQKLFIYFLIVIILSLSTVGIFIYKQSSEALDEQAEKYIAQVINNASYQTDLYIQTYERVSNSILSNIDVKRFLDMDPKDNYQHYVHKNQIQSYVLEPTFITYPQINMIYIIGNHGKSIIDDNQGLPFISDFNPERQLQVLSDNTPDNGSVAILNMSIRGGHHESTITIARKIRGLSSHEVNGVLAIELKSEELARIWDQVDLGEQGYFFILDNAGKTVYHPNQALFEQSVTYNYIHKIVNEDNTHFFEKFNGENRMFVTRTSDYSGWKLVVSMPVEELREPISTIRTTTLIVGFATLFVALWLAYRFGKSIISPIRILKDGMRETEKGNWKHIELKSRQDEVGGLVHSYNLMVSRLSEMIEKVYEAELISQKSALELQDIEMERQKAEFQALQLQINPHFLYNTLETINCYAIVQDSDEITEMVEAMAYMLRYSIQTNLEEITVANELNHARNYLIILKHRINHDFELDVIVPPSLLLEKMVRLTLQPLIENIFQHAFPQGIEDKRYIRIDAGFVGDVFQVTVEDNGVGIAQDKLTELRKQLELNQLAEMSQPTIIHGGGIGLLNVHRRIQMVFGEEYGLSIESILNRGTKMIMNMPREKRENIKSLQHSGGNNK
jgi:two-component system sensor histidine kinase YesM